MSADNWTICPQCVEIKKKTLETLKTKVEESYGKVTSEQYLDMVREMKKLEIETELGNLETNDVERTLREDYPMIGIEDGVFSVSYSASCQKCGFSYRYAYSETVAVNSTPTNTAKNKK